MSYIFYSNNKLGRETNLRSEKTGFFIGSSALTAVPILMKLA